MRNGLVSRGVPVSSAEEPPSAMQLGACHIADNCRTTSTLMPLLAEGTSASGHLPGELDASTRLIAIRLHQLEMGQKKILQVQTVFDFIT